MFATARRWGLVTGGVAVGVAGVVGFAGTIASAEPSVPLPPLPSPATVTQTVVVQAGTPGLADQRAIAPVAGAVGPGAVPAAGLAAPAIAPVPAVPTIAPATSGTIAEFLRSKNVAMEPQVANGFTALNIVLPMPTGWAHVPDPNVPDAFAVIADRVGGDGLYTSNAALNVYKLIGDFDPKEAISHGFIESQQLPAWRSTDGSMADFGGMPASIIEGTYRQNNMTLNTSRRHVIAQSGPDRYLVTLSVTTSAQVSVAAGDATDAIVNGFRVASAAPPPPPAAPPAPGIPGLPPLPPLPGIPS
ncbi:LpqN/LpqT family lipoprotein [Mycolicibacterium arabiense]|uniref:LpqN/LpqT family lipoprotein n=1 Tax=Mycolicibacterium arabiense TaxID=1286181 RepID=UPI0013D4DB0B|nr:LpqN/LpqT family lipoprotein [Mycolicibacterium arabiense]MCV7371690.1 LpqN/LpqT family lipoprotein [Mycolicibacterium arabiense]